MMQINKCDMRKKCLAAAILAILGCVYASAQKKVVEKIIEEGTTNNQVMNHLDVLTGRFGGRLVGSDAYENAADWMMYKYGQWGIPVRKELAGQVPVGFNRDAWFGRVFGIDGLNQLHFATPSYTSGTHGKQMGHVLCEPRTLDEFNRMRGKLKGAWVLLAHPANGYAINKTAAGDSSRMALRRENEQIAKKNEEIRRYNRENNADSALIKEHNIPVPFYREMCDAGVLGFIQSARIPICAMYDQTLVRDSTTTFDNLPTQPEILLDKHQFELINQAVKEWRDVYMEFDIRNHFKLGPIPYHNIVAEIKGSEYPDEYVIISGHLDAYDVGTGAIDCGTGIGPMMEAARLLAVSGAKPKRTIRFVAFAAEEFGLLGAQAYCKAHADELPKIAIIMNRDGGPEPPVGIAVPKAMMADMQKICEPIASINPRYPFEVTEAQPRERPTRYGSNDATVFAVEGVPTYGFRLRDVDGTNFTYYEIWHTENDILNKEVPDYQKHTAMVTAIVALGIANLDHQLSRDGMFTE